MADWIGWHFLRRDRRLTHGDGRKVRVGKTLTVPGPVQLCAPGTLHASRSIIDALRYASGPIACRVRLGADVVEDGGRAGSTSRTCLAMVDATQVLQEFACDVAEAALHAEMAEGREPDPRSWAAVDAKRRWLRGEISGTEMTAAWKAAEAAAIAAAMDATEAAVTVSAMAAATAAARNVTKVAAEAARVAYWLAARPAADCLMDNTGIAATEFEADLTARVMKAIESRRAEDV